MESFSPKEIDKPKNGIELKMLLSQNKDDLICPICQNLIWNYTDCSQCGNLFCSSCINESLSKVKDSCPVCKTTPFKSSGSKALKKLFVNIKLKCPNQPCDEKIEYSEYINHLEKCKYRKYTISEIINGIIGAGFTLERFDEHPSWEDEKLPGEFTAIAKKNIVIGDGSQ